MGYPVDFRALARKTSTPEPKQRLTMGPSRLALHRLNRVAPSRGQVQESDLFQLIYQTAYDANVLKIGQQF